MRKLLSLILILLVLSSVSALADETTTVRLTLVGDCILGSDQPLHGDPASFVGVMRKNGNDYTYPLKNALHLFTNDDFTLINLECVFTDNARYINSELFTNFRGPSSYVNILTESSVEGVSISNNHALDFGPSGLADCQKILTKAGVKWAYNDKYFTFEKDDIKIAVLSFRRYYMEVYYKWIEKEIPRMKAEDGVDAVIICLHHGTEYQEKHNDEEQTRFAHHAIDSGADLVVGTHPHVLQGIEAYKGRLIFYSLGNFSFGGNDEPFAASIPTAVMSVDLTFENDELYSSQFTIHPYRATGTEPMSNYQPIPVTGDAAQEVMDILQRDTPFTLNPFIEGEGAVQDIVYANN